MEGGDGGMKTVDLGFPVSGFRWERWARRWFLGLVCWKRENGVERERGEDEVGMAKQGSGFWVDVGERERAGRKRGVRKRRGGVFFKGTGPSAEPGRSGFFSGPIWFPFFYFSSYLNRFS